MTLWQTDNLTGRLAVFDSDREIFAATLADWPAYPYRSNDQLTLELYNECINNLAWQWPPDEDAQQLLAIQLRTGTQATVGFISDQVTPNWPCRIRIVAIAPEQRENGYFSEAMTAHCKWLFDKCRAYSISIICHKTSPSAARARRWLESWTLIEESEAPTGVLCSHQLLSTAKSSLITPSGWQSEQAIVQARAYWTMSTIQELP